MGGDRHENEIWSHYWRLGFGSFDIRAASNRGQSAWKWVWYALAAFLKSFPASKPQQSF